MGCKFIVGMVSTNETASCKKESTEGKGSGDIPSVLDSRARGMDENEEEARVMDKDDDVEERMVTRLDEIVEEETTIL